MATAREIVELLSVIKAAFPSWKAEEDTASAWLAMLSDLCADELRVAILSLCSEPDRVYAPSIGEIRGKVAKLVARQSGLPDVYQAWEELLHAPPDGIVRKPPFWSEEEQTWILERYPYRWSHPLVEQVSRRLGWPGRFPGENLGVSLAQFRDAYQSACLQALSLVAEPAAVTAYLERARLQP